MIKLIAAATIALFAVASTAQATPRPPTQQLESMITQVREGCGAGRVRIDGVCVTRRYGYYGTYNRGYYGYGYRPRYYGYGPSYRRYGYRGRPYRAYRRWN